MSTFVREFRSSSGYGKYEAVIGSDGIVYCNCMGWKTSKVFPKTCKHMKALVADGTVSTDHRMIRDAAPNGADDERFIPPPVVTAVPLIKVGQPNFEVLKPMLAIDSTKVERVPWDDKSWVAENKYDGIRLLLYKEDGKIRYFARTGNEHTGRYLWLDNLLLLDGTILDGELVTAGDESQWGQGNAKAEQRYVVFDVIKAKGIDTTNYSWTDRRLLLETIVRALNSPLVVCSTVYGTPTKDIMDKVEEDGGEGLMLKRRDSLYQVATRSPHWIKSKVTFTVDVAVIDMDGKPTSAERIAAGWKNLRYGFVMPNGKLEVVGQLGVTGPPDKLREHIGKVAEVRVYGVSPAGGLRHPYVLRYRDDKLLTDCHLGDAVR